MTVEITNVLFMSMFTFVIGAWIGQKAEARLWREYGDHEYMNTKE